MKTEVLDFLKDLKNNNNREWFQVNKNRYEIAKKSFESFINDLIPMIHAVDPGIGTITAKDCAFRIYRDVRFSTDKSPYKTNMGAFIAKGGKASQMAGYYVHIEPGGSFLAGGIYMPQPDILKKIREEIFYNTDEFKKMIFDKKFVQCFNKIDDSDKMKNPPKGFDKNWPDIELLKYRSFAVMHRVEDERLTDDGYAEYAVGVFKILYPLNIFFNRIFV